MLAELNESEVEIHSKPIAFVSIKELYCVTYTFKEINWSQKYKKNLVYLSNRSIILLDWEEIQFLQMH